MPRLPIHIDSESSTPLYRQLREALEHGIASGLFSPDKPLPSSRALARELSVSRNTVTLAYQELIAEGFVESRPRSGLYVNVELARLLADPATEHNHAGGFDWSRVLLKAGDVRDREVAKHPRWHEFPYPFLAGQVHPGLFPTRAWLRALHATMDAEHVYASLQDSQSLDDPLLIDSVCRELVTARGFQATPEEVLITLGSQHGLHLVAQALLGPGRRVAVEEPGYPDARHVFARAGAALAPTPVDTQGFTVDAEALRGVTAVHVTPSHQYPTNVTLSAARRRELMGLAERDGIVVIEDDYDSEFRYRGRPTPALKALDRTGQVVYLGSFSKFLAPGLRLGYIVAAPELIEHLRRARRYQIRHPPGQVQRAVALLAQSGDYARTVRHARNHLGQRWARCVAAIDEHLGWHVSPSTGGVSLWVRAPETLDTRLLAKEAQRRGVLFEPGDVCFYRDPTPTHFLRLGFGAMDTEAIEPGIRELAKAVEAVH